MKGSAILPCKEGGTVIGRVGEAVGSGSREGGTGTDSNGRAGPMAQRSLLTATC